MRFGNRKRHLVTVLILFTGWFLSAQITVQAIPEILIQNGHLDMVSSVAFSPDGRILASGSTDTAIKLRDVPTGRCLASLLAIEKDDYIVYTPDGTFDCSAGAAPFVTYRVDDTVQGLERYGAIYRRPDFRIPRVDGKAAE